MIDLVIGVPYVIGFTITLKNKIGLNISIQKVKKMDKNDWICLGLFLSKYLFKLLQILKILMMYLIFVLSLLSHKLKICIFAFLF